MMRGLQFLAGLLALLSVILWVPLFDWFVEIYCPIAKVFVLNAFLLTAAIMLFSSTASQYRKKQFALGTVAVLLLIPGAGSLLVLTFTTIPPPLDTFGFNHEIQVGSHHVEARKTRLFDISSGAGEILVRETKPLTSAIRLVKKPIAIEDFVTGINLRKIDDDSFSFQFVSDDTDYPLCKVQFNR